MSKIPKFKTEAEEARFWDTHDTTKFLDECTEVKNIKFPVPKHKSIVINLEEQTVNKIKKIAIRRKIPYHTLIQRWIKEKAVSL